MRLRRLTRVIRRRYVSKVSSIVAFLTLFVPCAFGGFIHKPTCPYASSCRQNGIGLKSAAEWKAAENTDRSLSASVKDYLTPGGRHPRHHLYAADIRQSLAAPAICRAHIPTANPSTTDISMVLSISPLHIYLHGPFLAQHQPFPTKLIGQ